jgi:hypothetical protein
VFQHAYFTICAMYTSNCHQSFLARPQYTFDLDFESSLYPPARATYTLVYTNLEYDHLFVDRELSTWQAHGWVFQKDNLSSKKLLFGQLMVHFECGVLEVSENAEISPSTVDDWSAAAVAELSREKLYRQFTESTKFYADRELSYESD